MLRFNLNAKKLVVIETAVSDGMMWDDSRRAAEKQAKRGHLVNRSPGNQ